MKRVEIMKAPTGREAYLKLKLPDRDWTFGVSVQRKAADYLESKVIERTVEDENTFLIHTAEEQFYRVRLGRNSVNSQVRWASCNCAHGSKAGFGRARCSHVLAVLIYDSPAD